MTDEQEHSRVRTVLDDVADETDRRTAEGLVRIRALRDRAERIPVDTDPRIENDGKPLRIRGMVEDGKLTLPGEPKDG